MSIASDIKKIQGAQYVLLLNVCAIDSMPYSSQLKNLRN